MGGGRGMERASPGGKGPGPGGNSNNGKKGADKTLNGESTMTKGGMSTTTTTACARTGRTVVSLVVVVSIVVFTTWVCVLYTTKLRAVQDRVDMLEQQCSLNERSIQQYVEEKIDILLKEVCIHIIFHDKC